MKSSLLGSRPFKRALILSLFLHIIIFALVGFSNYLTTPSRKGMVHYVNLNFVGLPGGGGGGSGTGGSGRIQGGSPGEQGGQPAATSKKETMKELTVAQKAGQSASSSLRHPVEKQKRSKTKEPPKKTEISAPLPGTTSKGTSSTEQASGGSGAGSGGGSGLRIGVGEGSGGGGFGYGYGDPLGTSSFPYTYYLQIIVDRVSSNWFTAVNNIDFTGEYQAVIYFKILRNGQIADLKIEQPSNLPALDLTARRAVELAAPFPPLPRDYENDYLVIHLIFERNK
ncbi:MAG: TonB C-terminal domain-containing protein [Candidatus Aminicenantes bacterium]|nr:TonB C-terminal domain-containing protein [Candidatus Aminicenantes bacterium]